MQPPPSNLPAHLPQSRPPAPASMLLVSTDEVPGYRVVRVFGLVKGNTVRARNIGTDLLAGFRAIVGGVFTGFVHDIHTDVRSSSPELLLTDLPHDSSYEALRALNSKEFAYLPQER